MFLFFLASLGKSIWEGFLQRCEYARPYGVLNQSNLALALFFEVLEPDLGNILSGSVFLEAFNCPVYQSKSRLISDNS